MFKYFFLSIETAYRLNESDPNTMLPKIPCHPIGYGVAKTLMRYGVDVCHMYTWFDKCYIYVYCLFLSFTGPVFVFFHMICSEKK